MSYRKEFVGTTPYHIYTTKLGCVHYTLELRLPYRKPKNLTLGLITTLFEFATPLLSHIRSGHHTIITATQDQPLRGIFASVTPAEVFRGTLESLNDYLLTGRTKVMDYHGRVSTLVHSCFMPETASVRGLKPEHYSVFSDMFSLSVSSRTSLSDVPTDIITSNLGIVCQHREMPSEIVIAGQRPHEHVVRLHHEEPPRYTDFEWIYDIHPLVINFWSEMDQHEATLLQLMVEIKMLETHRITCEIIEAKETPQAWYESLDEPERYIPRYHSVFRHCEDY